MRAPPWGVVPPGPPLPLARPVPSTPRPAAPTHNSGQEPFFGPVQVDVRCRHGSLRLLHTSTPGPHPTHPTHTPLWALFLHPIPPTNPPPQTLPPGGPRPVQLHHNSKVQHLKVAHHAHQPYNGMHPPRPWFSCNVAPCSAHTHHAAWKSVSRSRHITPMCPTPHAHP